MSGGSFDYLYSQDISKLLYQRWDLHDMIGALKSLGYEDAAKASEAFETAMDEALSNLEKLRSPLVEVWRAVEWCVSGDTNEDDVAKAIKEWRQTWSIS
jgi:hypothetical protein